jgi:hypothetical protein
MLHHSAYKINAQFQHDYSMVIMNINLLNVTVSFLPSYALALASMVPHEQLALNPFQSVAIKFDNSVNCRLCPEKLDCFLVCEHSSRICLPTIEGEVTGHQLLTARSFDRRRTSTTRRVVRRLTDHTRGSRPHAAQTSAVTFGTEYFGLWSSIGLHFARSERETDTTLSHFNRPTQRIAYAHKADFGSLPAYQKAFWRLNHRVCGKSRAWLWAAQSQSSTSRRTGNGTRQKLSRLSKQTSIIRPALFNDEGQSGLRACTGRNNDCCGVIFQLISVKILQRSTSL